MVFPNLFNSRLAFQRPHGVWIFRFIIRCYTNTIVLFLKSGKYVFELFVNIKILIFKGYTEQLGIKHGIFSMYK